MKKYLLAIVGALLITSCQNIKKENEQLNQFNSSLIDSLTQKNAELESMLATISDIQAGFDQINEAEGHISLKGNGELGTTAKEKMMDDLQFISQAMDANRQRIAELESKLKSANGKNASLQKIITGLNNQLNEKSTQIAQLQEQINKKDVKINELTGTVKSLESNVSELQEYNEAQTEQLNRQDKQLNRAWYVFGTAKELKEQNILKNGKVLGEQDLNLDYFTAIDIRHDDKFPLYAKHADLLTTHPAGSYQMQKDADGNITFVITDPTAFWSLSRYMVIKVK